MLRPRIGAGVGTRPRLLAGLNAALKCPLILVIGPAGYGKTTLLSTWLAESPLPSAWLALDEGDDDLVSFVAHVIAALQTSVPGVGTATLELINLPQVPSPVVVGATLCDELLDLDNNVILVLDDYHVIDQPVIHEFLVALLRHPAPALHLVISARRDPHLPVARLRLRGLVAEVRTADLRFTGEETQAFLSSQVDTDLTGDTIGILQRQTEGWIAGLRLAALALRAEPNADNLLRAFELHGRQHVMDILLDEVLAREPVQVQAFLVRTAVVDRICPSMADALLDSPLGLGGGLALLEGLARDNLFVVSLGEDGIWFRYHHLFRELLRTRLVFEVGKSGVAALHARASAWYEQQDAIEDAIRHALAAGDPVRAGTIVESHTNRALESEGFGTLGRWLSLLPENLIYDRPGLLVSLGWSMQRRAHSAAIRPLLLAAQSLIDDGRADLDPATARAYEGHLAALSIMAGVPSDHPTQMVISARTALDLLPSEDHDARGFAVVTLGIGLRMTGAAEEAERQLARFADESGPRDASTHTRALLSLAAGHLIGADLRAAEQAARRLLGFGIERNHTWATHWGHLVLGQASYQRNAVDDAIDHLALVVGNRPHPGFTILRDGMIGLGLAYQANGQQLDAQMTAARLVETLVETEDLENSAIANAFGAELALLQGDDDQAFRMLESLAPVFDNEVIACLAVPALARLRILLARGLSNDVDRALEEGTAALERFRDRHNRRGEIETLALLAMALRAHGQQDASSDMLAEAVDLAAPGGLVRVFVDLGPTMAALLREQPQPSAHSSFLNGVLSAIEEAENKTPAIHPNRLVATLPFAPGRSDREVLPERLTEREMEVLERLHRRLSNKEIAEELFISPLTVKRHASNIYGKLGVQSRRQAIRRSRELALLPQA
ncbi:MAG TPA: LuxR C-terminal-related transcriptional regulator [Thermomicrobiales bacterium]